MGLFDEKTENNDQVLSIPVVLNSPFIQFSFYSLSLEMFQTVSDFRPFSSSLQRADDNRGLRKKQIPVQYFGII
jgi:hypothetical protein